MRQIGPRIALGLVRRRLRRRQMQARGFECEDRKGTFFPVRPSARLSVERWGCLVALRRWFMKWSFRKTDSMFLDPFRLSGTKGRCLCQRHQKVIGLPLPCHAVLSRPRDGEISLAFAHACRCGDDCQSGPSCVLGRMALPRRSRPCDTVDE